MELSSEKMWYANGLNFQCTGCGKCCTGSPGVVFVSDEEVHAIASHLQISYEKCRQQYTRQVGNQLALKERGKPYDCIFLHDKQCRIYPCRPTQCQTFPFWPKILKSRKNWEEAASDCEGINQNAPLIDSSFIESQRLKQEQSET